MSNSRSWPDWAVRVLVYPLQIFKVFAAWREAIQMHKESQEQDTTNWAISLTQLVRPRIVQPYGTSFFAPTFVIGLGPFPGALSLCRQLCFSTRDRRGVSVIAKQTKAYASRQACVSFGPECV